MSVITDHSCNGQSLVDRVKFWGRTDPDVPAFIFWCPTGRRVLSRGDVLDLSSRFAYRLTHHGVKPGDVVCIALPNSPERVVVEFGIHFAGAVSMNGQVLRADGEDLFGTLIKAKSSAIVLDPGQRSGAWDVCKSAFGNYKMHDSHIDIKCGEIPSLTTAFISRPSLNGLTGLIESLSKDETMIYQDGTPQDICAIFTTSGSTGYSKLVPHTQETLLTFDYCICQMLNINQGTNVFDSSPFGWLGGFPSFYLYSGCTQVALDESHGEVPDKSAFIWNVLCQENIKYAILVPAFIESINERRRISQKQGENHKLSKIITGGQPVTKENVSVIGQLTDSVTITYGSTEFCIASGIDINATNLQNFQDDMAGISLPGIQLKIVDKDLITVPALSRGEILVQSPTMCTKYIGSDVSSQGNFLADRWFRTGDIGYLREDGCLFVEGRSSDAIMHGAYILYPTWLEQILVNCPGVKDVVIVPVPDKVLHHEICACVHLDDTADVHPSTKDLINFCRSETVLDKSSSLNIVPKYVIFVTEFPQTKTDKLDRRRLAQLAKEQLHL